MQLIKPGTSIDFVGKIKMAIVLSGVLIAIGIASLVVNGGPNYGIDFAGGTLIQVQFAKDTGPADVKDHLSDLNLGGMVVQSFGDEANEFLIRVQDDGTEISTLSRSIEDSLDALAE